MWRASSPRFVEETIWNQLKHNTWCPSNLQKISKSWSICTSCEVLNGKNYIFRFSGKQQSNFIESKNKLSDTQRFYICYAGNFVIYNFFKSTFFRIILNVSLWKWILEVINHRNQSHLLAKLEGYYDFFFCY